MKKLIGRTFLAAVIVGIIGWLSFVSPKVARAQRVNSGLLLQVTTHGIKLTWVAPTTGGAPSAYIINRGIASGAEVTGYASVVAPIVQFEDTAVTSGTTYYYTVTSFNSTGTAAPSNEASATFLAVPGSVTGLVAVSN